MPIIQCNIREGRTEEQKQALAREITRVVHAICHPSAVSAALRPLRLCVKTGHRQELKNRSANRGNPPHPPRE